MIELVVAYFLLLQSGYRVRVMEFYDLVALSGVCKIPVDYHRPPPVSLTFLQCSCKKCFRLQCKTATLFHHAVRGYGQLTIRWGCRCGEGRYLAHYIQGHNLEKDEKANIFRRHPDISCFGVPRVKISPDCLVLCGLVPYCRRKVLNVWTAPLRSSRPLVLKLPWTQRPGYSLFRRTGRGSVG